MKRFTDIVEDVKSLSNEEREQLYIILYKMIQNKTNDVSPESVFGSFESGKSAEEVISEIRADRNFNRKIESF